MGVGQHGSWDPPVTWCTASARCEVGASTCQLAPFTKQLPVDWNTRALVLVNTRRRSVRVASTRQLMS